MLVPTRMDSDKLAPPAVLEPASLETLAPGASDEGGAEEAEAGRSGEPSSSEPEPAQEPLSRSELERGIAALLFASPEPLSTARLASLLSEPDAARVEASLAELGRRLAQAELPYELRSIAGGWQLYTSPDVEPTVLRLAKARKEEKVSPAALETLSVVAYRQPVTKAEIEAIRGVQVGPILRALVDRGLVRVAGRSDVPGHPLLYATTKKFLDAFALARLEDLPRDGELLRD